MPYVQAFLGGTGIEASFGGIDEARMTALLRTMPGSSELILDLLGTPQRGDRIVRFRSQPLGTPSTTTPAVDP